MRPDPCPAHVSQRRLERALAAHARSFGVTATMLSHARSPWASATFTGARHRLVLAVSGGAAADWADALPEAELAVPGHLVADLEVGDRGPDRLLIAALLLEAD